MPANPIIDIPASGHLKYATDTISLKLEFSKIVAAKIKISGIRIGTKEENTRNNGGTGPFSYLKSPLNAEVIIAANRQMTTVKKVPVFPSGIHAKP